MHTGEVPPDPAPALNTVFYRFSREEVRYIITYGRPGSPMSAWGLDGGGPLNSQQIDTLLAYLESIQIPREDCILEGGDPLCESGHLPAEIQADIEQAARQSVEDGTYDSYGEALFNLDLSSGAYSCARCYTNGWSYGDPGVGPGCVRLEPHGSERGHAIPGPARHVRVHPNRLRERGGVCPAGTGHWAHAGIRAVAHG